MIKKPKPSVKEAFDNLPAGLCFFNRSGLPVLCNRTMERLVFALTGRDLQHISDLENALIRPAEKSGVTASGGIYRLPDASSYTFASHTVSGEDGEPFTEYIASDVTALCNAKTELERDNAKLREMASQLRRLCANVAVATREEEILSLKMRVHDQMGRCLLAARKILVQDGVAEEISPILKEWHNAVNLLRRSGGEYEESADLLSELARISGGMIKIVTTGELPKKSKSSYLLMTAIRECVTNALRYAAATELYTDFSKEEGYVKVRITNNGNPPNGEISEGGGLSSLRSRIEKYGGKMEIRSLPVFELTAALPLEKEDDE